MEEERRNETEERNDVEREKGTYTELRKARRGDKR